MKKYILTLLIFLLGCPLSFGGAIRFAPSSPLAEGSWIKIGVAETGLYEISYSTLRAMGFGNPEKVGVFGRGGRQFDMNFTDADGKPLYTDQLPRVSAIRHGEKLYFYGIGPEQFRLTTDSKSSNGRYESAGRNIYTDLGYYFLCEVEDPADMESAPIEKSDNAIPLTEGVGRVSHHLDIYHNNSDTGQLFYGEKVGVAAPALEWNVRLNGLIPNSVGNMECYLYFDKDCSGVWSYGVHGDASSQPNDIEKVNTSSMRKIYPLNQSVTITDEEAVVYVEVTESDNIPEVSNLDYWTLTYRRDIPMLMDSDGNRINQEEIGFPQLAPHTVASLRIPGGASYLAIDITDPASPRQLPVEVSGRDGLLSFRTEAEAPRLLIFDPLLPQSGIKGFETGYSRIANQNLHKKAAEGAELIIICIPQLADTARRLADLHMDYDGSTTLIATTDECYNEFSAGIPDPMAYRALVRAVYDSPKPCKNVMLLGPLYADFRGIVSEKHRDEGIIAYQTEALTQKRGAINANDILGMMADHLELYDLHANDMEIGVGILPVRYEGEAETILKKIEKYMDCDEAQYYLNAFTQIGGIGDNHTHDEQAIQLSNFIDRLSDYATVSSNLPVDAYGHEGARRKLFENFNEGRLFMNYFGHGSGTQLNQTGNFFMASDIYHLRNRHLPFMGFAGCSLSSTDKGYRGMGESIVLSTEYGAIGTLLATRETWSAENANFFDTFYVALFRNGPSSSSPAHNRALTIGEVFARAKTNSFNNNELAYQLICDPALILPVTTRSVNLTELTSQCHIGERMEISGYVADDSGTGHIDAGFNGKFVATLLEPVSTYISDDLCTVVNNKELRVPVSDRRITMAAGEVKDGEFSVSILIPPSAYSLIGKAARLQLAVYDPVTHTAGGGLSSVIITRAGNQNAFADDLTAPIVEHLYFDPDAMELHVRVSDNLALSYSDDPFDPYFRLTLDGKELPSATQSIPVPEEGHEAYSKSIPLPDLQPGIHSAKVAVKDAAGNKAYSELTFEYKKDMPTYTLKYAGVAATESAPIYAESGITGEADIIITDSFGNQVRRERFPADGAYLWDIADDAGHRVAPGLYKAYLLETGNTGRNSHSSPVSIPVAGQ